MDKLNCVARLKILQAVCKTVVFYVAADDDKWAMLRVQEMIKRCHQCMNMIVSAKEHQAAEANKNAAILLEELSLEREREETKKAAAARKRDRKKLKKRERADRDKDTVDDIAAG